MTATRPRTPLLLVIACVGLPITCELSAQEGASPTNLYYADAATGDLVERARRRHGTLATELGGYRAKVLSRVEGRIGPSRFGRGLSVFRYLAAARMRWTNPGHVKVDIEGARMASLPMPGFGRDQAASFFADIFTDQIWFIPSSLGDEIELLGLPDRAALHPFSLKAADYYRFAIADTLVLSYPQRRVRVVSIQVTPLGFPRGQPLFSGRLWLDADSLDVVRLTGTFVGDNVWDEDDDAPELVSLEVDIEYTLHENRFWLPHRQVLTALWRYKYLPGATLPGEAIVTFSEYELDREAGAIAFAQDPIFGRVQRTSWNCPDAWEFDFDRVDRGCGDQPALATGVGPDGRWEISLPTADSLRRYAFDEEWSDELDWSGNEALRQSVEELATVAAGMPNATQRPNGEIPWWTRSYDLLRYNRVTGPSFGGNQSWQLPLAHTTLRLDARASIGQPVLAASATLRREVFTGRLDTRVYRGLRNVEPWTDGLGPGNSAKALFLGHDDADYYVAHAGGEVSYHPYYGPFKDGRLSLAVERQASAPVETSLPLSGRFQPNPAIVEGTFVRGRVEKSWLLGLNGETSFTLGGEMWFAADSSSGRLYAASQLPYRSGAFLAMLRLRGGVVGGSLLPQTLYRLGGPHTVRGYGYGVLRDRAFWSAQSDFEWTVSQWWSPRLFVDAAGGDFERTPLVGAGVGVSFLSGWVRTEFGKGLTRGGGFRFDIVLEIPSAMAF